MRSIFGIHSDPALQFALKLHLDTPTYDIITGVFDIR